MQKVSEREVEGCESTNISHLKGEGVRESNICYDAREQDVGAGELGSLNIIKLSAGMGEVVKRV